MRRRTLQVLGMSGVGMFVFAIVMAVGLVRVADAGEAAWEGGQITQQAQQTPWLGPALVLGSAIAISASCLGAGYAVGKVGAAAFGAISERPELLTRSLLFVALAEGIAIYGLVVAVMLVRKV